MPPYICFGGGTIGSDSFSTADSVLTLFDRLKLLGIHHIDAAPVYPATAPGACEYLLGVGNAMKHGFTIDTKIKVTGKGPGRGSLKRAAIEESVTESVKSLGVEKLNTLYCHIPDPETPVEETAATLHQLWTEGKFQKLGLSNYSPDQVEEFMAVCKTHGWVKPSAYQGQYNALWRGAEDELLPLLRRYGIAYVAFSPLAGGFLTGNFSLGKDLTGTRFEVGNVMGAHYRPMYDKAAMHAAVKDLDALLQPRGVSVSEAALRWLFYHSALGQKDGVVLGATGVEQVERNMAAIKKGPLQDSEVDAFERVWRAVGGSAP